VAPKIHRSAIDPEFADAARQETPPGIATPPLLIDLGAEIVAAAFSSPPC
jgi:hypothetical protein